MQSCITLAKVGKRQAGHAPVPPKRTTHYQPFSFYRTQHFTLLNST